MPGKPRREFRTQTVLLVIIIVAAAGLRLWGIGAKSLWLDEVMTVRNASMPYARMVNDLKTFDVHPPLFQTVAWLWVRLGHGDGFVRIPSAFFGVLSVWLAYLVARRLLGKHAGLCAAALMACSHFHIYYSQEARLYALVTALFLAQTYVLLRILEQRGKAHWGWWAGYGALALASLYTYALCILTIGALALVYLVHVRKRPRQRQIRTWIAVHVIVAVLFAPWVPVVRGITAKLGADMKARGVEGMRPHAEQIANGIATWGIGPTKWQNIRPYGALLGGMFVVAAGSGLFLRRAKRPAKFLAILFCAPLLGYLMLPMPRVHAYDPKHLALLQPLLLIALAGFRIPVPGYGGRRYARPAAYITVLLAALNLWMVSPSYRSDFQKERWPDLCAEVVPQLEPHDALVFNPERLGIAFAHYAKAPVGNINIRELSQRGAPLTIDAIRRFRREHQNAPIPSLARFVRRVWVIDCVSQVSAPEPFAGQQLRALGFEIIKGQIYRGSLGYVRWIRFQREDVPSKETEP